MLESNCFVVFVFTPLCYGVWMPWLLTLVLEWLFVVFLVDLYNEHCISFFSSIPAPKWRHFHTGSCHAHPFPLFGFFFSWQCLPGAQSTERASQSGLHSCLLRLFCWEKCPAVILKEKKKWEIWLMSCPLMWGCAGRLVTGAKPGCWEGFSKREDICMFHSLDWNLNSGSWMQLISKTGRLCHLSDYMVVISHWSAVLFFVIKFVSKFLCSLSVENTHKTINIHFAVSTVVCPCFLQDVPFWCSPSCPYCCPLIFLPCFGETDWGWH